VVAGVAIAVIVATLPYSGPGTPQLGSAQSVRLFDEPFTSGLRSAHVVIQEHDAVSQTSQGEVLFRPTRAMELTTSSSSGPTRTVDIHGIEYSLSPGARRWTASTSLSPLLWYTGWDWPQVPYPMQVAGQVRVDGTLAWHLVNHDSPSSQVAWWIGVKDGYPLKISYSSGYGVQSYDYSFSQFNSPSAQVQAPPAGQVSTRQVTGGVGDLIRVPWAQVQVTSVDSSYTASGGPPAGYRFVAVHLMLRNAFGRGWNIDGGIGLTDDTGIVLNPIPGNGAAPALPGSLSLAPGQAARGWLTFQVPSGVHGLTLQVAPPDNGVGNPLVDDLISIPLG